MLSLRRAYYASISYVDSLVGQVLSSLSELGLDSNTVVMFVGDHGWQLGEHGEWCKHTNFELAVHAPMILKIPELTDHVSHLDELVEFVDVFPTIADAAGLPVPKLCPENSRKVQIDACFLTVFSDTVFITMTDAMMEISWPAAVNLLMNVVFMVRLEP